VFLNSKRYELLLYVSAVVGVLYTWYNGLNWAYNGTLTDTVVGVSYTIPMILAQGMAFTFFLAIAYLTWLSAKQQRRWAIWAVVVLYFTDLFFPVETLVEAMSVILRIASLAQILLPAIAFYFYFSEHALNTNCSTCTAANPAGARFCRICGAQIASNGTRMT